MGPPNRAKTTVARDRRVRACATLAAVLACLSLAPPARSCETPVYRYAMYRWLPAPYRVFVFHRGKPSPQDQEVERLLAEEAKNPAGANVFAVPVDLDRKDALESLPGPVQEAWKAHAGKPLPVHLVFTAWGTELFAGRLDAATLRAMIDSPVRTQIGKLFQQGHGVVLLVLEGSNKEENTRLEAEARQVMAKAAAGEILRDPGQEPSPAAKSASGGLRAEPDAGSDAAPRPGGLKVALVKLDRAKPEETWLPKMLLAMEPELEKHAAEPVLFAIFGRGRVMPPGVGKEVHVESLTYLLGFLADRCSCTVKDQNPGLDLLIKWDWEAVAEKFSAEEQAAAEPEPLYGEVTVGPGPPSDATGDGPGPKAGDAPASGVKADQQTNGEAASRGAKADQPAKAASEVQVASAAAEWGQPSVVAPVAAATQSPAQYEGPAGSFAARQVWQVGLGLAAVAAVVLLAGLVLMRKRLHDSP